MSYMDVMGGFGSQWTNAPAPPVYTPTYTPQQLGQQNQNVVNQITDDFNTKGPSSGYGTVGGYPSFGDPAPAGTYSPGGGRSSFSGTPLGNPSGTVTRGPDLYDLSQNQGDDSGIAGWGSAPIPFGGSEDMAWMLGGSQGMRPSDRVREGWDAAPPIDTRLQSPDYSSNQPVQFQQQDYFTKAPMPGFEYGGAQDQDWVRGGSQGDRPSLAAIPGWGGGADQDWVRGGSQGERPSLSRIPGWGGGADQAWVQGGSQGERPSLAAWGGPLQQAAGGGFDQFDPNIYNKSGGGVGSSADASRNRMAGIIAGSNSPSQQPIASPPLPQPRPDIWQQGTAPVQGEAGWVDLPQAWYNQEGTPNAKQLYDPVQSGGGFNGGGWSQYFPGS